MKKKSRLLIFLGALMATVLACTVSFGGSDKPAATEAKPESYYLQQTVQAQLTQMAGTGSGSAAIQQAPLENIATAEPPKPCQIALHSKFVGEFHIFLLDTAGGDPRLITAGGDDKDYHPSWSPDGSQIAFVSGRDGNDEIYVMNSDGSGQKRLTNNPGDDYWATWSPRGDLIAFTSSQNGLRKISVINPDGSGIRQVSPDDEGEDTHPTWSPDGTQLGFTSNRNGDWDIYTMNLAGGNLRQIVNQDGNDWYLAWSPDGNKLAYASNRGRDYEIYTINIDGSNEQQLTDAVGDDWLPAWAPDGSQILFTSNRGSSESIFVMNTDGSNQRTLIDIPNAERGAVMSPNCSAEDIAGWSVTISDGQAPAAPAEEAPAAEKQALEPSGLIQSVSWNRNTFFCVKSDGPATITFNAEMSDVDRGLAIFWRLYEKGSGKMTDWQNVSMTRKGGDERTFTFNADAFGANNNFFYPPLFGESWFQVQFVSGDGKSRTEIYRGDITFFPCAQ